MEGRGDHFPPLLGAPIEVLGMIDHGMINASGYAVDQMNSNKPATLCMTGPTERPAYHKCF